ncbi:POK18 protein, partial [Pachycephala philippinensis]|nr:POK18 protein [Pachycephala philippinensis]
SQWSLSQEWLQNLQQLVDEQLSLGHLQPSSSPWNTPVFCIPKKSGKWRLLHDLRAVNAVIEPMHVLQPGLPSPVIIPLEWPLIDIDLKDCIFAIPLHPDDAPHLPSFYKVLPICHTRFAFSVPTLNHAESMKRFHWTVLPHGMCNSPTICQRVVNLTLQPVCCQFPDETIYHYMDDILLAAKEHSVLCSIQVAVIQAVQAAGLIVAPKKVQQQALWHYLGRKITQQTFYPQPLKFCVKDNSTLNDLQKLLGSLNWLRPILGLSTEPLHPLFDLLRGNPDL